MQAKPTPVPTAVVDRPIDAPARAAAMGAAVHNTATKVVGTTAKTIFAFSKALITGR